MGLAPSETQSQRVSAMSPKISEASLILRVRDSDWAILAGSRLNWLGLLGLAAIGATWT